MRVQTRKALGTLYCYARCILYLSVCLRIIIIMEFEFELEELAILPSLVSI